MAKSLSGWLPLLIKQDCWKEVAFALRNYDRKRYGIVKHERQLSLVSHESAKAAVRRLAQRSRLPKFRTALSILEGPAVYETSVRDGRQTKEPRGMAKQRPKPTFTPAEDNVGTGLHVDVVFEDKSGARLKARGTKKKTKKKGRR